MTEFLALCAAGTESIVAEDIKKAASEQIELGKGMVFFQLTDKYEELMKIKAADDILIIAKKFSGISRYKSSLRNFRHQSAKANLKQAVDLCRKIREVKEEPDFTVKAHYEGHRDYTAKEVEAAVAEGITQHYGWKQTPEFGSILVNIIINDQTSLCAVSIDEKPLHLKNNLSTVPGSLKTSLAFSMLRIADVSEGSIVLDPMCGAGTIMVEAAGLGAKAIAGDIDESRLKLAKENCDKSHASVEFHLWDARNTGLNPKSIDRIISNLPFDKQVKADADIGKFFSDFLDEMIRISKDNAKFVFLTRHAGIIMGIAASKKGIKTDRTIQVIKSGLETDIIVMDRLS